MITSLKEFELFFRVANIYENCEIVIKDEEKELLRLKKKKLVPGQMEKIKISKEILDKIKGNIVFTELENSK